MIAGAHFARTPGAILDIMKWLPCSILILLLIILIGVVFHAPLIVSIGTLFPAVAIEVKAWKEILLVLATILVVVDVTRRHSWRELLSDWVVRIAIAYVLLHIVLLPFMWQGLLPAVAGLMIDLRFVVFFLLIYSMVRLYPTWRRPLIVGSVIAATVSMVFAFLQVTVLPHDILSYIGYSKATIAPYLTVDQNYDFIRINGTLRGPNPLGIYATIVLAACLAALVLVRQKMSAIHRLLPWSVALAGVVSVVAVWFSYSRSAKIALALAIVIVLVARYGRLISRPLWIAMAAVGLLLVGGVYLARDTPFVSIVILHEDPDEGGKVNSNDGHWESLVDGTERMLAQPLGAGIGSTGSASIMGEDTVIIENYYLYVAHETGWLGLTLFLALSGTVWWRLWQRRCDWLALGLLASGIGAAAASLFLPVWADDTVALVWWGLAGVAIASTMKYKMEKQHGRAIK